MTTSRELSPTLRTNSSDVLYLGKDLDIELWFKAKTDSPQSVLIRTTTPDGETRSAFMHIDGKVEQVPVFNNQDPLVLQEQRKKPSREFEWSEEIKQSRGTLHFITKISAALVALVFLASVVAGSVQLRVVLTGSMKPSINPGDLIVAVSQNIIEPSVGKVVLYKARDLQGKPVTVWAHRIISGDTRKGFVIKGDANSQADIGVIPKTDIQSVVLTRIPFVGHLFNIYSLILIFSGLLVLSFATSRKKRE